MTREKLPYIINVNGTFIKLFHWAVTYCIKQLKLANPSQFSPKANKYEGTFSCHTTPFWKKKNTQSCYAAIFFYFITKIIKYIALN